MVTSEKGSNCGIGGFNPVCLRPLANIKSFIVLFGLLGFLSWSLYTVTLSQISNVEKAFGLSSSESGWLLTVWEIGYVVCTAFVSYFSSRAHIPRVIGVSTVVCGLSGIIYALPHFIAFEEKGFMAAPEINRTSSPGPDSYVADGLCVQNATDAISVATQDGSNIMLSTGKGFSKKTIAFVFFNIGMVLQGAAKAPCYPYSSQYIDDNVDKRKTGFYVGIATSIAIFGLTGGYGVGSLVSQMYVTLEDTGLSLTDTRFIGAWWLGFMITGLATVLIALPMFFFPRRLTPSNIQKDKPTKRAPASPRRGLVVALMEMKVFLSACLYIYGTPLYTVSLIASCIQILGVSSFLGFEPKYMETQFAVPSWKASIILGVASIGSFALGTLLSGYVTKRYDMNPANTFRFIIFTNAMSVLSTVGSMFLGCPHQDVVTPLQSSLASLVPDCDCSGTQFLPICGDTDQLTYFSPCHAGCTNGTSQGYFNCSSIPGLSATLGSCPTDCSMLWPFSVAKFIMNMCEAMAGIPFFLVFLRSVGEERKALALGLSAATVSLLAWVPGPVLGGSVVDSTCLVWSTSATSGRYCSYYNIDQLRYRLHALQIGFRVGAILVLTMLLVFKARKIPAWPTTEAKDSYVNEQENDEKEMFNMVD